MSSANMPYVPTANELREQMIDFEKRETIRLYKQEWEYQRIGNELSYSKSTIRGFIKGYKAYRRYENISRGRRPKKITDEVLEEILNSITQDLTKI